MPNYAIKVSPTQFPQTRDTGGWLRVDLIKETEKTMFFQDPDGGTGQKPKSSQGSTWLSEIDQPIWVKKEKGRSCVAVRYTETRLAYRYSNDQPFTVRGFVQVSSQGSSWDWVSQESNSL